MTKSWIFLRGLMRGNQHWGDFPEKLKLTQPNLEIEFLEIPGNGTRSKERTPTDPHVAICQIRDASRLLKKEKSVNICGISLGGMMALKWAELYPSEVSSLTLINSSLPQLSHFKQRLLPPNYFEILKAVMTSDSRKRERKILSLISNSDSRSEKFLDSFAHFTQHHPIQLTNLIRQLLLANRIEIQRPLLDVPIKIICSKADRFVSESCSFSLSQFLGASILFHPTAGHDLPLDDPEWLIEQLIK